MVIVVLEVTLGEKSALLAVVVVVILVWVRVVLSAVLKVMLAVLEVALSDTSRVVNWRLGHRMRRIGKTFEGVTMLVYVHFLGDFML